jgi:ribose transport system substrate-binding protein
LAELQDRTDEESTFKGSVGFFPEFYGRYLIPMIVDMIEGNPVPDTVYLDHWVIDRSNIDEYYPKEGEVAEYVPEIRLAQQTWKIGYGNGLAADPFSVAVTENLYDVAEQMGVDVVECDNAYDPEKTLQCADLLITQQVDGIIFANWHADIAPAVGQKWIDAGVPAVTYDGPHPGAVDFGADNYSAGLAGGEYLGQYILDQGWAAEDIWLALVFDPEVGEGPNDRVNGCRDGLEAIVDIPDDQIGDILGGSFADTAYTAMTDWLTAHPDAQYVVGCSIDDPRATGMSGALEAAGMVGRSAIVGQGVTAEAFAELRRPLAESTFVASVAYTPELYGNYMVPIIVDLIEGNPVPDRVALDHFAIDRDNLAEWYPEEAGG